MAAVVAALALAPRSERPRRAVTKVAPRRQSLSFETIVVSGRRGHVERYDAERRVLVVVFEDAKDIEEEVHLDSAEYTLEGELERGDDEENVNPKDLNLDSDSDEDDDDEEDDDASKAEDVLDSKTTAAMQVRLDEVQRMLNVPTERAWTLAKLKASQPEIHELLLEETKATRRPRRESLLNQRVEVREADLFKDGRGNFWRGGKVVKYRDPKKMHTVAFDSSRRASWDCAIEVDGERVRIPLEEVTWKIQDHTEAPSIVQEKLPPPSEEEATFLGALRAYEAQQQKKRKGPAQEPAPKKKKTPAPSPTSWRASLAKALDPSRKGGKPPEIMLACAKGGRWDGTRPVLGLRRVPLYIGYPPGTEETTIGIALFSDKEPSEKGVYTIPKIVYEPRVKGKNTKKSGEVVYYRKATESDVEAIKEAFDLVY